MRKIQQWVSLAILVVGTGFSMMAAADGSKSLEVRETWSGWWNHSMQADVDGDMQGGGHGQQIGSGSSGRFSGGGSSDLALWDGMTFCDFDEQGYPIGISLDYVSLDAINRYQNGDLLYVRMASSPPSTLCFNFVDNSFTMDLHFDVIGGTGRFNGATGQIETKGGGLDFGTGFGSQYATNRGVIYGENVHRRGNSDKDD